MKTRSHVWLQRAALLGVAGSALAVEPAPATADDATIVVTAQRVSEDVQDVPLAVSVLGPERIAASRIDRLVDTSMRVPNLWVVDWGLRQDSYVYIRGVGTSRATEGAVGLYVDDVPILHYGSFDLLLHDLARIEVLRGPQGTLFGRNTLGGVINITTASPFTPGAAIESTFGNHDLQRHRARIGGPLAGAPDLATEVSVAAHHRDGYTHNETLDDDVDHRNALAGRGKLAWRLDPTIEATLTVDAEQNRDGALPVTELDEVRSDPHTVNHDFAGRQDRDLFGAALRTQWDHEAFTLTSISAWRTWQEDVDTDADFTANDVVVARFRDDQWQATQEVRVDGEALAGDLRWLGGAFVFWNRADRESAEDWGSVASFIASVPNAGERTFARAELRDRGAAAFAHLRWRFAEAWELTGGLRVGVERKEADIALRAFDSGTSSFVVDERHDRETFVQLSPKLALTYHVDDDLQVYASVTRGYKSGGFNFQAEPTRPSDFTYDPEFTWNFELGSKARDLAGQLDLAASGFLILWRDQQIVQQVSAASTVVRNAEESRIVGIELESRWRPLTGLEIGGAFGSTDAEYTGGDRDGNEVAVAPSYTFDLHAEYRHPLTAALDASVRVEWRATGDRYWDDANTISEDPYQLLALRAGVEGEHWRVGLWIDNALDEDYAAIAFRLPAGTVVGQAGPPRTYGISGSISF